MMPQPITNSNNAYLLLHELNKSQLNIGEIQISGLCSKCSALGKLLTQEATEHQLLIKKNKANKLVKEINEISTAINKNLVQQLPLIKKQMEQSLHQMTLHASHPLTNAQTAQDQTYVKTVDLLQQNIVGIDQRLDIAMKRVLEALPETKQNGLQKQLKALSTYQSTLCGASLISNEFSRLSIFLDCLKSNVALYLGGVSEGPEKTKLLEFSSTIDQLSAQNKILFESFQAKKINNLPIMKVFDSAKQKHLNLTKQLAEGDTSNADLLFAIAQRHETDTIVECDMQNMQLIQGEYDHLSKEVIEFLEKVHLEDINSLADELIQSEPVSIRAEPKIIKKPQKAGSPAVEQKINPEVASTPKSVKKENVVEKSFATQFNVELTKLADWLHHDLKVLKNSTSDEKRKLGQVIAEQLENVYGQIDVNKWPAGKMEVQQYKTDMENSLNALELLIAQAMAQNSPKASPQAETHKSPENVVVLETKPLEQQNNSNKNLPAMPAKHAPAQVVAIEHMPKLQALDSQLQLAIQKLNSARTKIFDAYSTQESFRQTLLESNQPHSLAWVNINQADMVLNYLSHNIAFHSHVLYVKPYMEHCLPMAEMIRSIQAERFHPHFDQQNCQAYLGRASNWLDTFTPHFEYLEQLMSVTKSMLTDKQRVA